jgi:hypothetical protein
MKVQMKQLCVTTIVLCLGLCLFPTKTFAYLDPGAGSSILQLLLAGLLGVLYVAKLYWVRIKSFVARRGKGRR